MQTLIGRDRELARIDRLLDERSALTLRGPRGAGVSALAEAAAARAAARGMRVLRARGVQAESGFPYAGLDQLLRPLGRRTGFADTPGPEDVEALDGDVFVCVDDWQWLDAPTREALVRLRVPALFAGHAAGPDAVEELRVVPLGTEAAELLRDDLPLLVRERILREAAGFPLALTELPLAYAGADDGTLLGSWAPLTPALNEAFEPADADADTAIARLVAALDDGEDLDAVQAAASTTGRPPARRRAGAAGVRASADPRRGPARRRPRAAARAATRSSRR